MAQLPAVGSTGWGNTLNEFLQVSHNSDGTIRDGSAVKSTAVYQIVALTQAAYNALGTKNSQTLYIITS